MGSEIVDLFPGFKKETSRGLVEL